MLYFFALIERCMLVSIQGDLQLSMMSFNFIFDEVNLYDLDRSSLFLFKLLCYWLLLDQLLLVTFRPAVIPFLYICIDDFVAYIRLALTYVHNRW